MKKPLSAALVGLVLVSCASADNPSQTLGETTPVRAFGCTVGDFRDGTWKIAVPPGKDHADVLLPLPPGTTEANGLALDFYAADLRSFSHFYERVLKDDKMVCRFVKSPVHQGGWERLELRKADGVSLDRNPDRTWAGAQVLKFSVDLVVPNDGAEFRIGNLRTVRGDAPTVCPKADERRLGWCPNVNDRLTDWDGLAAAMSARGFTDMIVLAARGANAYYRTDLLPMAEGFASGYDAARGAIAAAHAHGLKCHLWKTSWQVRSTAPKAFVAQLEREGRLQVTKDGKVDRGWMCPSDERNRRLEVETMKEFVALGADGIHFDYIRYADDTHCFCPRCLKRFSEQVGREVKSAKEIRADQGLLAKWSDFRAELISSVVKESADCVHALGRGLEVSAATYRHAPTDYTRNGQDWPRWCREGWMDFICPMDYYYSPDVHRAYVTRQMNCLKGTKAKLYPGIGVSSSSTSRMPKEIFAEQLDTIRSLGLGGYTVYPVDDYALSLLSDSVSDCRCRDEAGGAQKTK